MCLDTNGHTGDWTQGLPHAKRMWYHYTMCPFSKTKDITVRYQIQYNMYMKSTVHKTIRHNTVQNIKIYYNTIKYNHRLDEMQRAWIRAVCAIMSNIIPWLLYVGLRTYLLFGYCCVATQWLLYCTVLYCIVLCCIVLYCIALHCVVMYNNVPNCMVDWNVHLHIELYRTVLSNILPYNIQLLLSMKCKSL